jgi:hypothetical protein
MQDPEFKPQHWKKKKEKKRNQKQKNPKTTMKSLKINNQKYLTSDDEVGELSFSRTEDVVIPQAALGVWVRRRVEFGS